MTKLSRCNATYFGMYNYRSFYALFRTKNKLTRRQRRPSADLGHIRRGDSVHLEVGEFHDVIIFKHTFVYASVLKDEFPLKGKKNASQSIVYII